MLSEATNVSTGMVVVEVVVVVVVFKWNTISSGLASPVLSHFKWTFDSPSLDSNKQINKQN